MGRRFWRRFELRVVSKNFALQFLEPPAWFESQFVAQEPARLGVHDREPGGATVVVADVT
jgi:hypothetical protein